MRMLFVVVFNVILIFLDWLFFYIWPFSFNDLSLLTPMLSVVSLVYLTFYFNDNKKLLFIYAFCFGIVYDLFFSLIIGFNAFIFLSIVIIIGNFKIKMTLFKIITFTVGIIFYYELVSSFLIGFLSNSFNLYDIFYKFSHSLILNVVFSVILVKLYLRSSQ